MVCELDCHYQRHYTVMAILPPLRCGVAYHFSSLHTIFIIKATGIERKEKESGTRVVEACLSINNPALCFDMPCERTEEEGYEGEGERGCWPSPRKQRLFTWNSPPCSDDKDRIELHQKEKKKNHSTHVT